MFNQTKDYYQINTFELFLHGSRDSFVLFNIFVSPLDFVCRTQPTSLDLFVSITLPRVYLLDNYFSSWLFRFCPRFVLFFYAEAFGRQELQKYFYNIILDICLQKRNAQCTYELCNAALSLAIIVVLWTVFHNIVMKFYFMIPFISIHSLCGYHKLGAHNRSSNN